MSGISLNDRPRDVAQPIHPQFSRRTALQAGSIGLLGMGINHLAGMQAMASPERSHKTRACIYIFLSGGLSQQDSFDLKPNAPDSVRGEFSPIATKTPGIEICEHLPMLAQRSESWSLLRSLTHKSNDHTASHSIMLTGRSTMPPTFKGDRKPRSTDLPSIASVAGYASRREGTNLPPAVVLPEKLVHWSGGTIPGAYGGIMGSKHDPFFVEASPYGDPFWRGAYPEYNFYSNSKKKPPAPDARVFQAPSLNLPQGLNSKRFQNRLELLSSVDAQRQAIERSAVANKYDNHREAAISLLADPGVRKAFDVTRADEKIQERYGKNSFGWSLLMAFRMVQAGVNLVQVNLGNNECWDTHGNMFPNLKNSLFPPTDRALSALLDDLSDTGLLDETMVVMGGEFGRTPKISLLKEHYHGPGRDHWGRAQTLFFAGGGIKGGNVVGATDGHGGHPVADAHTPEDMAATIYHSLGIPENDAWHDDLGRPHFIYHGKPISKLFS